MSEEHLWHYIANEEQVGPITPEELAQLAAAGEIQPTTQVWTDTLDEWTTADQIEGLFPAPAASSGPRLLTGSAVSPATPLAAPAAVASPAAAAPAAAAPAAAAPVAAAPAAAGPGFSLGGSLSPAPHKGGTAVSTAVSTSTSPDLAATQSSRFQLRSVGILQAGVVMALLMAITSFIILLLFMMLGGLIGGLAGGSSELSGLLSASGIMLVIVPIIYAVFGFLYGIIAALIYNLAAKMCGGLVVRVQAVPF